MATINEVRSSIYNHFTQGWGSTTPYTFDNEEFDIPQNTSWVRLVVRNQTSKQDTMGKKNNRQYERRGVILVQVFTPLDIGTSQADELSTLFIDLFEGENVGAANVYEATAREIGPSGAWYQVNIDANFLYNEKK